MCLGRVLISAPLGPTVESAALDLILALISPRI